MEDSYQSPPIVLDTNVLVAGACRHESSLAYLVLLGILEQTFPIFLTEPIVLEYLDVLARPRVRALTGLTRRQSEALVTDLTALSRTVQLRFSWRPNLRDDLKQKAQQLAKEQGVSLNGFINATLAAAVAQQETLTFFSDRLRDVDQDALHKRVLKFMRNTRSGKEPSIEEIERAMRG